MPTGSRLLFFLDCEFDEPVVEQVRSIADRLSTKDWPLAPPEVVDQWDTTVDGAVRTVGLLVEIPADLDSDVEDADALRGVEAVVAELSALTSHGSLAFGAELDGTSVGWVEQGAADRLLVDGLLRPWCERHASSREAE